MSTLAAKSYDPGDVIYTEKPFIRVLRREWWDKICAGCCAKSTGLRRCTGCGVMNYCGKSCQKNDWPDHKLECPYLRNYTDLRNQEVVQMIGKLILKLKGKDWKTVTSRILDSEVSFDDLLSNADIGFHMFGFDFLIIGNPLESFIGKENMPDKATLQELFGKVVTNRFAFHCGEYPYDNAIGTTFNRSFVSPIFGGAALFLGVSKLDHSCVPNACFHAIGSSITVRAIRNIKKSEKITIAYTNMVSTEDASLTHELTKFAFREKCYCSDCSQVFGESKLTKILDPSKAIAVILETERTLQLYSMLVQTNCPNPKLIVTRGYLKDLLKRQDEALGRTHLRRLQLLAILYSLGRPDESKEERRAGYVELTESMKEVWGDYYPELAAYYRSLARINQELGNQKEARAYCYKVWRLESVMYGTFFHNNRWEDAMSEREFRYLMDKNGSE